MLAHHILPNDIKYLPSEINVRNLGIKSESLETEWLYNVGSSYKKGSAFIPILAIVASDFICLVVQGVRHVPTLIRSILIILIGAIGVFSNKYHKI